MKNKLLQEQLNSLPEYILKFETPYWLTITRVLKSWQIKYQEEHGEILLITRNRDILKATKDILKKIKNYQQII